MFKPRRVCVPYDLSVLLLMMSYFVAPKKIKMNKQFPACKGSMCAKDSLPSPLLSPKHNNDVIKPCGKSKCMTCNSEARPDFSSTVTKRSYRIINHDPIPLTCSSSNIIYLISCSRCGVQYVGETTYE